MFVRKKKTPLSEKTAIQLVKSVRVKNKVRQKIIRHFGYAHNEEEIKALTNLALQYKLKEEAKNQPTLFDKGTLMDRVVNASKKEDTDKSLPVNLKDIIEEKRIKVGIHQVYGNLFEQIGFQKVIEKPYRRKSSVRVMRDIVMSRIDQPESKLATTETLNESYGIKVNVNSVYRMMDLLDKAAIERIKQISYQNSVDLLGGEIDVIFYDCTTLYFESFIEDELKQNGYSKDNKFNQGQVILALMVTTQGLPIGYELFPGSTFEGHTLSHALDRLHDKYKVGKVIFTSDSALVSKENIKLLQERNQPYIVGARIKNMNKKITSMILDPSQYHPLYEQPSEKEQENITYQELWLDATKGLPPQRLIVSYSPKRAAKDSHDRQKAIDQLTKRLKKSSNPKSLLSNYGYKKYISIEGKATIKIKEDKIKEAEKWDGLHGILTNISDMKASQILSHYKGLWQVEETFRISKHNLQMRPIFHWTSKRIKAHIALCFMALVCVRTLEYRVRLQYKKLSPERIRKALSRLEVSVLKDTKTGKRYILPSQASQHAKKIYQILGLRWRETPYIIK